jgi:hypothetical protein
MKSVRKDRIRVQRIENEAIVDAYGLQEQAMGWYYYLENNIHLPFQPKCIGPRVVSPLRTGEIVEVHKLAPENACTGDMLVLIRWQGRNLAVPLSQLTPLAPGDSTEQAIADWHYWISQGYRF